MRFVFLKVLLVRYVVAMRKSPRTNPRKPESMRMLLTVGNIDPYARSHTIFKLIVLLDLENHYRGSPAGHDHRFSPPERNNHYSPHEANGRHSTPSSRRRRSSPAQRRSRSPPEQYRSRSPPTQHRCRSPPEQQRGRSSSKSSDESSESGTDGRFMICLAFCWLD